VRPKGAKPSSGGRFRKPAGVLGVRGRILTANLERTTAVWWLMTLSEKESWRLWNGDGPRDTVPCSIKRTRRTFTNYQMDGGNSLARRGKPKKVTRPVVIAGTGRSAHNDVQNWTPAGTWRWGQTAKGLECTRLLEAMFEKHFLSGSAGDEN